MAYFKVRNIDTGKFMDKRHETVFSLTGGIFGTIRTARKKKETIEEVYQMRLLNNPDLVIPSFEIVQFNLVEIGVIV